MQERLKVLTPESRPSGSSHIREFVGTLSECEAGSIGIFVSHAGFSQEARVAHLHSTFPLMLCRLDTDLSQVFLNPAAKSLCQLVGFELGRSIKDGKPLPTFSFR